MGGTVKKLMNLKKQLLTSIKDAEESEDTNFAIILKGRLTEMRYRIYRTFEL